MRAICLSRYGGPEVLKLQEYPDPQPGAGEVLVQIHACGLNFADIMARQGLYPDAPKPPTILGYEASGVVQALGAEVEGVEVGQRVMVIKNFGAQAELVCVPSEQVFLIPESMSFEQAAALPVNYLTAYYALFYLAHVQPKEQVLIHMAAGGVGTALLQLSRLVEDLEVYGTASGAKHEYIREQGCDYPIDYRLQDYKQEVLKLASNQGLDVIFDPLGGKDWLKGYQLLKPGGRLVAYGFANLNRGRKRQWWKLLLPFLSVPSLSPFRLMNDNKSILGLHIGRLWHKQELFKAILQRLLELYMEGKVKPVIDKTYSFEDVKAAHERMHERKNCGKIILVASE